MKNFEMTKNECTFTFYIGIAIIHGHRDLIRLYKEKVKKVIERVWEG